MRCNVTTGYNLGQNLTCVLRRVLFRVPQRLESSLGFERRALPPVPPLATFLLPQALQLLVRTCRHLLPLLLLSPLAYARVRLCECECECECECVCVRARERENERAMRTRTGEYMHAHMTQTRMAPHPNTTHSNALMGVQHMHACM